MKIMILTVTAGFGHHATAKALSDMFESKDVEVTTVDVYEYISKIVYDTISKGYLFSTKYAPEAYRLFYQLMEHKDKNDILFDRLSFIRLVHALGRGKFSKIVEDYMPDAIICTHVFAAQLADVLKREKIIDCMTVGVVTDYTIHPFWENVGRIDHIVLASDLLSHLAAKKGVERERQLPLGIPINPKFNKQISKSDARNMLNLDKDRPTILVMGGSMGYSNGKKIVKSIDKTGIDFQIIAVCGNNKKQEAKLNRFNETYRGKCSLTVIGFATNVDILMSAADCIVTKPGGLTVSEALSKKLPMILVDPIPGQEERNVEFLMNNGIASKVTKTYPLDEALYQLFKNPARIKLINETIADIARPNATSDIADFIISKLEN